MQLLSSRPRSAVVREEDRFEDCGDCALCQAMQQHGHVSGHHHAAPETSDDSDDDEFFLCPEDDLGRETRLVQVINERK